MWWVWLTISRLIPVRVIWAVFEQLAGALCLMHNGCLPGEEEGPPNEWPGYMHLDLKPLNSMESRLPAMAWLTCVSPIEFTKSGPMERNPSTKGKTTPPFQLS